MSPLRIIRNLAVFFNMNQWEKKSWDKFGKMHNKQSVPWNTTINLTAYSRDLKKANVGKADKIGQLQSKQRETGWKDRTRKPMGDVKAEGLGARIQAT